MTLIKICGISEADTLQAAIDAGADFIGLVFYPPSPRFVSLDVAEQLQALIPAHVQTVGLFVDPVKEELDRVLARVTLDMIQLHGDEPPETIRSFQQTFPQKINKAVRIGLKSDLEIIKEYEELVDWMLIDSKNDQHTAPGGTGQAFDWKLLQGHEPKTRWMLAGGLTPDNVTQAITMLAPEAVDVSSGVESEPGRKDAQKIKKFIHAVKQA